MDQNIKNNYEMNGNNIVVDTNVQIYLLEGKRNVEVYLKNNFIFISVITEIELLGWFNISDIDKKIIYSLLKSVTIVDVSQQIKEIAISLKQQHKIKLPDAIIAATAINLGFPIISFDRGMKKMEDLNLIIIT